MRSVFATLGFRAEKVVRPLNEEANVERLVVFAGDLEAAGTRAALVRVGTVCQELGIGLVARAIGSSYDFVAAAKAYRNELQGPSGVPVLFNVTGGTGVMQTAATFVAFTHGIPVAYYNTEERKYVRMPPLRLVIPGKVSPHQLRVLSLLLVHAEGVRASELARRARLSLSNLDHHAKRLVAAGLVERRGEKDSARTRLHATEVAKLLYG